MKKILFTGARSGIASKVIDRLLNQDYYLYVSVHTEKEKERIQEKYRDYDNVECLKLDITSKEDRQKLEGLDLDILVSNAAVGYGGSLIEIPMDKVRENFEVNVFSNFEVVQIVLKKMIAKKEGKIILLSSLAGILPIEFLGSYCSTKASIIMMAKVLRKELKLLGCPIKVKVIEPGIYKTGFNEVMLQNKDLSHSIFQKKKGRIHLKEFVMFELLGKKDLDSIASQIECAILSNNNQFIYSAPISQKAFAKIYQVMKG